VVVSCSAPSTEIKRVRYPRWTARTSRSVRDPSTKPLAPVAYPISVSVERVTLTPFREGPRCVFCRFSDAVVSTVGHECYTRTTASYIPSSRCFTTVFSVSVVIKLLCNTHDGNTTRDHSTMYIHLIAVRKLSHNDNINVIVFERVRREKKRAIHRSCRVETLRKTIKIIMAYIDMFSIKKKKKSSYSNKSK